MILMLFFIFISTIITRDHALSTQRPDVPLIQYVEGFGNSSPTSFAYMQLQREANNNAMFLTYKSEIQINK